jgi:PKD repeat protein
VGTTFSANTATYYGGGATFYGGAAAIAPITVAESTFMSNTATGLFGFGGGAWFGNAVTVSGTIFSGNSTTGGGNGGGAAFQSFALITGTTFTGNSTYGGHGGGASFSSAATIMGTRFLTNTATLGNGGGAFFHNSATVTGTTFANNTATGMNTNGHGGGVYFGAAVGAAAGDFTNSLFSGNHAQANQGAAIYAQHDGNNDTLTLRHTTIASPTVGSGSALYVHAGMVNITNTIVASYSVGLELAGGTLAENYNLFSGVTTPYSGTVVSGGHSVTGTAAFEGETTYRLTGPSAARDAGTDIGVTVDFEGDPRGCPDIGWDEVVLPEPVCGLQVVNSGPTILSNTTIFTATVTGGALPINYSWDFGDGTALGSGATTTHTYGALGNYTATITATNSLGSVSASTLVTISQPEHKLYLPLTLLDASVASLTVPGEGAPLAAGPLDRSQVAQPTDAFARARRKRVPR